MKQRILLVTGAPALEEELRRHLLPMADVWELSVAGSGSEALGLSAERPFDVALADMRISDMTGAELLLRLGQQYPRTLRFVLADPEDKDLLVSSCGWGTHQFVAKPIHAANLITIVQRALALEGWLSHDGVRGLSARFTRIPSLPASYFEVVKRLESPTVSMQDVGEAIARDVAMTARLLQVVNSAFYGMAEKVSSPADAVAILGVETVKSLLLCIQVFTQFDRIPASLLSMEGLWNHSLVVAQLARQIALAETGDPVLAEKAFTAGLLHDVGKLALASNVGEDYRQVLEQAREYQTPVWNTEFNCLQASHAEVGGYLLGLWGMPVVLVEATAFHHQPALLPVDGFSVLTAVHVADALDNELKRATLPWPAGGLDLSYLRQAGLEDRLPAWRELAAGKAIEPRPRVATPPKPAAPAPKAAPPVVLAVAAPASTTEMPPRESEDAGEVPALARGHWHGPLFWPLAAAATLVFAVWLTVEWMNRELPSGIAAIPDMPSRKSPRLANVQADASPAPVAETNTPDSPGVTPADTPELQEALVTNAPPEITVAASPADDPPIQAEPSPLPSLRLQSIFYSQAKPSVRINQKTLFEGDTVDGARVVAISAADVVLDFAGQRMVLSMR